MIRRIIFLFFAWRFFLFLPLIVAKLFLLPRIGYEYTNLSNFLGGSNQLLSNFLLYPYGNFDGIHYLLIAANGYTNNAGFFPLFPLSINVSTLFFGLNIASFDPRQYFTAIILTSFYFLFSLLVLRKLIKLDYAENIAIWSIVFLLIFPTSFFFASIYSESLFLLLSLLSFYFARKRRWFLTGILGALLSATRLVGIAIWPALLYEYFKENKNKISIKILPLLFVPLGLISYIIYNFYKWGNPFYFIAAQGNFQNNRSVNAIVLFPQTVFRYMKILLTVSPKLYEWKVALSELSFFLFASIMIYVAWKKKVRISYLIFGILCLLIPASSGTFSGLPRYVLIIFPIFITLALIKSKLLKIVYSIISIILLFIFFMLFSKGYFIA